MSLFRRSVFKMLCDIRGNAALLEMKHPEMKKKLDAYCGKGQGLGNKASDQEACFAVVCEENSWMLRNKESSDGLYYVYQAQGTQKAIDFQLVLLKDKEVIDSINIDLKHSDKESIFLNDGTFLADVLYIISFTRILPRPKGQRKGVREQVCMIAPGQDIMSENDKVALEKRFAILKQMNSVKETLDFLTLYVRNANQYSCKVFTPAFTQECFTKTRSWILPSL